MSGDGLPLPAQRQPRLALQQRGERVGPGEGRGRGGSALRRRHLLLPRPHARPLWLQERRTTYERGCAGARSGPHRERRTPTCPPPPCGEGLGVGGANAVVPLRFAPQSTGLWAGAPLHLASPCAFAPPLSPPHQGEGDVVAGPSPHYRRRVLCRGSHAPSTDRSWHDPHPVENALTLSPQAVRGDPSQHQTPPVP
jgi:hypothetical protein